MKITFVNLLDKYEKAIVFIPSVSVFWNESKITFGLFFLIFAIGLEINRK